MRKLDSRFVRQKVEYILSKARIKAPPINLALIAQFQCVRTIELRPMLIGGCIEPVAGGFRIYIQNRNSQSLSVDDAPDLDTLKPRQRFTLAHEIAHTFFYDLANGLPQISKQAPKSQTIERLCQQGASQILLPDQFLMHYLNKRKPLDLRLAVELGKIFKVSAEVVIRRIDEIESVKSPFRALLLARLDQSGQNAQIRAICFHHSLLPILRRPQLYSDLKEWSNIFLEDEFWTEKFWNHQTKRESGTLLIKKRSHSTQENSFFIEVEFTPLP